MGAIQAPTGEQSLALGSSTWQVLSENLCMTDGAWGLQACVPRMRSVAALQAVPRCLSSIKDFLWVVRAKMFSELCVHPGWARPSGQGSL